MLKSIKDILILFTIGYSGICLFLYLYQPKFIYFPSFAITIEPSDTGLEFKDLMIKVKEKIKINAWYIPSKNAKSIVIFFHGNGGNMSHRMETLLILNKLNLSVIIFDYQGYGKSDGKPSEDNTYEDANAVLQYVNTNFKDKYKNFIMWGRSLGGAVAIDLASKYEPDGLIVESTFSSIPDMASHLYPFIPARYLCLYKYDSFSKVENLNCKKLFIHSPKDDIVPFKLGKKLYKNAKDPKKFVEIKGNHNGGFIESGDIYLNPIKEFLKEIELQD